MSNDISRRAWLAGVTGTAAALGAQCAHASQPAPPDQGGQRQQPPRPANDPFTYCLNTSTISGQKLTIVQEIDIAAKAGYQGIEPWIRELDQFVQNSGDLADLRKRIQDAGLRVESAIGFCEWIVDDDNRRKQAIETARRDMDRLRQIGGTRIAAPPVGATKQANLSLARAAERYRALCEVGQRIGVVPQVEVWGFSTSLGRLGEAAQVAIDSGHPQACILADVYHLYKGGSSFTGLRLLNGAAMHCFHMNDYPAQPPRADITDAHRVHCGDGVAPLTQILRDLRQAGFRGALSLELFNRDYWKQDALQVARTGLEKMRAAVRRSLA